MWICEYLLSLEKWNLKIDRNMKCIASTKWIYFFISSKSVSEIWNLVKIQSDSVKRRLVISFQSWQVLKSFKHFWQKCNICTAWYCIQNWKALGIFMIAIVILIFEMYVTQSMRVPYVVTCYFLKEHKINI